jgi:tRNA pseudouridine13 synthase
VLPYLTADLPGTGGTLRAADEDFVVDELPAYLPSGSGDHVYVRIEKRGLTTPQVIQAIARALGVRERDIGAAGMKDRHAVTTQWLSLPPPVTVDAAGALAIDRVAVLEVSRHANKLKTGHLRGNRFRIRVRGARSGSAAIARAVLARLCEQPGAPNWFGEQRFGRHGDNAEVGQALVTGARAPSRDRRLDRLMVSALQSELFNTWLVRRLADGLYRRALAGDLMHKRNGGMFACDDPATDTARIAAGEIVPTGPMFGTDMRACTPGSVAAAREDEILAGAGLTREAFATVRAIAEGTRRDAAIAVTDPSVAQSDETLEVAFALPAGAYATVVMREIMKTEAEPIAEPAEPT